MSSPRVLEVKRKKNKKNIMRSLNSWWKKKRSFYLDMQQDEASGVEMHDVTLEGANSDFDPTETPVRGIQPRDRANVTASPYFDVSSMYSPPLTTTSQAISEPRQFVKTSPHASKDSLESRLRIADGVPGPNTPSKMNTDATTNAGKVTPPFLSRPVPFVRRSFSSGSLESMDSLAESYWDPDDDEDDTSSQVTPIAANGGHPDDVPDFFAEHVNFLRVQTRPRKVEEIWSPAAASPSRMHV